MVNSTLGRKYFLLLLDGIFYYARPCWPNVLFKTSASFMALIFCLGDQPIDVNEVLKSSAIIVLLSIFPFNSINVCFRPVGVPMLGV